MADAVLDDPAKGLRCFTQLDIPLPTGGALRQMPRRTLAVLLTMFNFAERRGERADGSNPCRHVEKYPQHRRERFLSSDELGRLGDALTNFDGSPHVVAAIKLLVFTGARLGEVLG